jgi:hypothetical protein
MVSFGRRARLVVFGFQSGRMPSRQPNVYRAGCLPEQCDHAKTGVYAVDRAGAVDADFQEAFPRGRMKFWQQSSAGFERHLKAGSSRE